jgi:MerR family copper efflux transcriptional regulator
MSTFTIGEAAERSGFSTSALRYYDGIGVVPPAHRSEHGYRLYDDRSLARLAFLARAKQLGCHLDEVIDLLTIWDHDRCGPVQQQLHELVTAKLADAERQAADTLGFADQLRQAARRLGGPVVDGPCQAGCACSEQADDDQPDDDRHAGGPPLACSLVEPAQQRQRDAWRDLLGSAVETRALAGGGRRIAFDAGIDVRSLAGQIADEQRCCPFFSFALTIDRSGVTLDVRAPAGAEAFVDGLLGPRPPEG